jgi:hypothetical protein
LEASRSPRERAITAAGEGAAYGIPGAALGSLLGHRLLDKDDKEQKGTWAGGLLGGLGGMYLGHKYLSPHLFGKTASYHALTAVRELVRKRVASLMGHPRRHHHQHTEPLPVQHHVSMDHEFHNPSSMSMEHKVKAALDRLFFSYQKKASLLDRVASRVNETRNPFKVTPFPYLVGDKTQPNSGVTNIH